MHAALAYLIMFFIFELGLKKLMILWSKK